MNSLTTAELEDLRAAAEAAQEQLDKGPKEWPGRPSAQRLALFLAASPDVILQLLHMIDKQQSRLNDRNDGQAS